MEAFILTMMILHLLSLGIHVQKLSSGEYKKPKSGSALEEWIAICIGVGFVIWAYNLIF